MISICLVLKPNYTCNTRVPKVRACSTSSDRRLCVGNNDVQVLRAGEGGRSDAAPLGRVDQGDHLPAQSHDLAA